MKPFVKQRSRRRCRRGLLKFPNSTVVDHSLQTNVSGYFLVHDLLSENMTKSYIFET